MIISASRRTDIPSYYSDWFFNRIKAGNVLVRNPMNIHQISKIDLSPDIVDGIVFWKKNPLPMIERLDELRDYMFYFQFTITPYGRDIEPRIPDKNKVILPAFKKISKQIGAERMIWRFDPILISRRYSVDYHIIAFEKIAAELEGYARKVTISFIDTDYKAVKSNTSKIALLPFPVELQRGLAARLAEIGHKHGLMIDTCAEKLDLSQYGIEHARCIDDRLFSELLHCKLNIDKDKSQRLECGCVASIDIGMYNSCSNVCRYCYANYNQKLVAQHYGNHNPLSPLISGEVGPKDRITIRKMKSFKESQLSFFD